MFALVTKKWDDIKKVVTTDGKKKKKSRKGSEDAEGGEELGKSESAPQLASKKEGSRSLSP
jgi:hypothetical protein